MIFKIFNKRIGIIFLACVVIIAGAIFTWLSHKRLQIVEKEHANLSAQLTTLKTRLHTTKADLEQAKADLKDEESATTTKDLTAMHTALMARVKARQDAYLEHLKTDPKLQEKHYEYLRYGFSSDYGVFFAREHLTPGQTDKIIKALKQREMDKDDLKAALQDQGLSADDPGALQIKQQSQAGMALR